MSRGISAAWLAAVCLVIFGCGSSNDNGLKAESDPSVPFATHDRDWDHDALARGTLILQDGCVYLEEIDRKNPVVLIFPEKTNWDASTQTLTLNGRSAQIGEQVVLIGGGTGASVADYIPEGCEYAENDELFMVGGISPPGAPE